jgi:dihydroxyacetone kinase DhaKLM complex PTS-EIIA-like component DhaM
MCSNARDDDPSHEYVAGTGDDDNGPTVEQVATAISRADTPDLLDIAEDLISGVRDTKQAVQLRALATDRRLQLGGE